MADQKKTVKVLKINTDKIAGAGGKYFNEQFKKHARKSLQAAGFFPPVDGKAKYAIDGLVTHFKRDEEKVSIKLECDAHENDKWRKDWGTAKSSGSVPDVKGEKDFLWALDALADNFSSEVVNKFKGYFV